MSYVAPEALRNKGYTQTSDVYYFGIVTYEILSGSLPYCDLSHDEFLTVKICEGLRRPQFQIKIPSTIKKLNQAALRC
jgi:serine/threonine protein kinase